MRLNEFTDPKDYTPTAADAEEFLNTASASVARSVARRSCTIRAAQQKTAVDRAKEPLRRAMNACRRPMCWLKFLLH